ncbi:MAG: iron hydrogenase small subunit [Caldisericaceae bacterium]|nr:iron hydrogenase small subunit [Caldisericaceae bacterium]
MFTLEVNGRKIEARNGETILDVLNRAGVKVPTLCHMKELFPSGACRVCSVEVEGFNTLIPSCAYPAQEGMVIKTNSPRVIKARKTIIELLLANHVQDCLYCVRNGDCELQELAAVYGVRERRFPAEPEKRPIDVSSPSIIRDQNKCILCGKCVRTCEEIMGVSAIDFVHRGSKTIIAPAFEAKLNVSSCINCGQCVLVCPTGALRERSYLKEVTDALQNPNKFVVVQHAPAVSVTISEEFGLKPGKDVDRLLVNALRRLGFDRVFDTAFSADLTIMEEASELVERLQNGSQIPMMTSCSPGWIKYVEQFYPEFIPNISTCKSPQQMLGAVIKNIFAKEQGIAPENIFSVAIMPCTAKKFEAERPEFSANGYADIDAVLTTRELARLIRMYGIEFDSLEPQEPDSPFGTRTTAGKLFGGTGGVMEAALRTVYYMITGKEPQDLVFEEVRGLKGVREARVKIGDIELGVAVANGIKNAKALLEQIKAGRNDLHFIEVMTCPGGCIGGGGQPFNTDQNRVRARLQALYQIDQNEPLRASHQNPLVNELYEKYLERPLSHQSHKLLHTNYAERDVLV